MNNNLSTYFILPLVVQRSKEIFGKDNYVNSYITKDGYFLILVRDHKKVSEEVLTIPTYIGTEKYKGCGNSRFLCFDVPNMFKNDVELFRKGLYSRMSVHAKALIRIYSGLIYKGINPDTGYKVTSDLLLALDRDINLRRKLEMELDVSIDENAELLSRPKDNEFINYNFKDDDKLPKLDKDRSKEQ